MKNVIVSLMLWIIPICLLQPSVANGASVNEVGACENPITEINVCATGNPQNISQTTTKYKWDCTGTGTQFGHNESCSVNISDFDIGEDSLEIITTGGWSRIFELWGIKSGGAFSLSFSSGDGIYAPGENLSNMTIKYTTTLDPKTRLFLPRASFDFSSSDNALIWFNGNVGSTPASITAAKNYDIINDWYQTINPVLDGNKITTANPSFTIPNNTQPGIYYFPMAATVGGIGAKVAVMSYCVLGGGFCPGEFVVTYDSQAADTVANPTSQRVTPPATTVVTLPTAPVKNGHTFGGWWTEISGGGTQFFGSTTVTADITVYAKWIKPDLTALAPTPGTATAGTAQTFNATITNSNAPTGAGLSNFLQVTKVSSTTPPPESGLTPAQLANIEDKPSTTMATLAAGATGVTSTSHTFGTNGTYYIRACADKTDRNNAGVITESDETNNCGPWTPVIVLLPPPPTPTGLAAAPSTCGNNWLNLSWNITAGATSYQIKRNGTSISLPAPDCTSTPGSCKVSDTGLTLGATYTYTITASNAGGTSAASSPVSGMVSSTCDYTLTITTAGTGGGTTTGAGTYTSGTSVTATATPDTTSTFIGWSGDCNASGQVTMNANKTCIATFTRIPLTANCSPSSSSVTLGQPITWTANNVLGGIGNYTYSWSGTDGLTGTTNPLSKTYTTVGQKTASVLITSGTETRTVSCPATTVTTVTTDMCNNIEDTQTTIPVGLHRDNAGNCVCGN